MVTDASRRSRGAEPCRADHRGRPDSAAARERAGAAAAAAAAAGQRDDAARAAARASGQGGKQKRGAPRRSATGTAARRPGRRQPRRRRRRRHRRHRRPVPRRAHMAINSGVVVAAAALAGRTSRRSSATTARGIKTCYQRALLRDNTPHARQDRGEAVDRHLGPREARRPRRARSVPVRSSPASRRSCSAGCSRRRPRNTEPSSRSCSRGTSSRRAVQRRPADRRHVAMRHPYAEFLSKVEKPSRYVGGEYQQVRKDPATRRGARLPGVPRRLRHRDEPPRVRRSSTRS